jgi:hypothetical protein
MTIGIFKEWLVKYFFVHSIIWQLLLSVKWHHMFSYEVKTGPIYGMGTNKNPEMAGFKISWFWPSTNHSTSK